ncbi:phage tail assembly protein T [Streptomyces phaeochromogenes]
MEKGVSVDELLRTHTSAELTEWMAYEQISGPFGPERLDVHMAILAATVSNTVRSKGRKASPRDFLPEWDKGSRHMDWQSMLAAVKTMNRQFNGDDLTEGGEDGAPGRADRRNRDGHAGPDQRRARRRKRG